MEYYQYTFLLFITTVSISMVKDYLEVIYLRKEKLN